MRYAIAQFDNIYGNNDKYKPHILEKFSYNNGKYTEPEIPTDEIGYYDSYKEAQNVVTYLNKVVYVLSHNEYARPEYLIIDENTAEYIHSGRNGDMSNYDWDRNECACGECKYCIEMMNKQDNDYLIENAKKIKKTINMSNEHFER